MDNIPRKYKNQHAAVCKQDRHPGTGREILRYLFYHQERSIHILRPEEYPAEAHKIECDEYSSCPAENAFLYLAAQEIIPYPVNYQSDTMQSTPYYKSH